MADFNQIATDLLDSASRLLLRDNGPNRVFVFFDGLPDDPNLPEGTILVIRNTEGQSKAQRLAKACHGSVISVPKVTLERPGQINLAAVIGLSQKVVDPGELAVILVGKQGELIDSLRVVSLGDEFDLFRSISDSKDPSRIRPVVFQRVVTLALSLASEGREGKPVGTLFVLGDSSKVAKYTEQLIINPFRGYPEESRNILDTALFETIKGFATIDGAFVIRGNGVIESAGTLISAPSMDEALPKGLGARHAAAAGITRLSNAVAITVSESDGVVRVWSRGKPVTDFSKT